MDPGGSLGLPGSSDPPPYTISDGRSPAPFTPSCPPSKSPLPNHRPFEAFGDFPTAPYGTYPQGQMQHYQLPPGQMPHGQMYRGHGQPPPGQMPSVHMSGPYGNPNAYGYPPGQGYPGSQFGAPGQPSYYPPYAAPHQRPQQQQQQSVVIVGGSTPRYNQPVVVGQSFVGQMCLACFVFWCCGGIFGAVAFVLAAIASSQTHQDPTSARQLGRASLWVSVAGIVVSIVVICVVLGVVVSRARYYNSYYYY